MTFNTRQQGFSLIELLIVMIIIGLLASLVGPRLFGHVDDSKIKTAQAQIELLGTALDSYRLDIGSYPSTEQGLQALRQEPSRVSNWNGPYLPKQVPQDPWDNAYQYKYPGEYGEYDLWSDGPEDEGSKITSWGSS